MFQHHESNLEHNLEHRKIVTAQRILGGVFQVSKLRTTLHTQSFSRVCASIDTRTKTPRVEVLGTPGTLGTWVQKSESWSG